jgi:diaminohydroxyphosphoribosylaminopyrimidine deaminase/5-amino-6-(5-phosphoribosylamino)uracil reductase
VEALSAATPAEALAALGQRDVTSLLVEGGAELAAGLLAAGVVDALALFLAPKLIGGDGRPLLGPLGVTALADAPQLLEPSSRQIGPDVLVEGLLHPLP